MVEIAQELPASGEPSRTASDGDPGAGPTRWIVVVDGYSGSRDGLCRLLEEIGYSAIGTANASEAIARAGDRKLELLVVTHDPPWTDALEVAGALRATRPRLQALVLCGAPSRIPAISGGRVVDMTRTGEELIAVVQRMLSPDASRADLR